MSVMVVMLFECVIFIVFFLGMWGLFWLVYVWVCGDIMKRV